MNWHLRLAAMSLAIVSAIGGEVAALEIRVVARDLLDIVPGEDLWQYEYTVSDAVFDTDQAFALFFDHRLYGALSNPGVANADWDLLTIDPDTAIPADGIFDALALTDGASLADPFHVDFVWIGTAGLPQGIQPYQTYVCNDPPDCLDATLTGSGTTVAVPGPAPLGLLAGGLSWLGWSRRARRMER